MCSEQYLRRRTVDGYTGSGSAEELRAEQKQAVFAPDAKLNGNANSFSIRVCPLLGCCGVIPYQRLMYCWMLWHVPKQCMVSEPWEEHPGHSTLSG
jgi:hypothetical protein